MKKISILAVIILIISCSIVSATDENEKGDSDTKITEGTGFFEVAQDKNGVWWFVTPNGEKFYSTGCTYVDLDNILYKYNALDKYGSYGAWANLTADRLETWGINTISGLNSREFFQDMPYVARFRFKQLNTGKGWTSKRHPDVFDPMWQEMVKDIANEFAIPLKEDPNLIGYYTDNEMKWGADQGPVNDTFLTIIELYMSAPKETPGKQRLVQFIIERYDNVDRFNQVWRMNLNNFDELFNHKEFGRKAWHIGLGQAKKDIDDFSRLVANTYFNVTSSALKAADPNHLNLGVRFHPMGVPKEVLEECAKYVDVISINYYRNFFKIYDPGWMFYELLFDCVPYDRWLERYYEISNKPILISEFNYVVDTYDTSINSRYFSARCSSPKKQADNFERYARNCLDRPYTIGYHWFTYKDGYFSKWGLVDFWDEPNTALVDRMAEINNNAIELHQKSCGSIINKEIKESLDMSFIKCVLYPYNDQLKSTSNYNNDRSTESIREIKGFSFNSVIMNNKFNDDEKTIYVDDEIGEGPDNPYEDFTNIQDAIEDASAGDTIFVYNGIYNEKIIINKSINLIGENPEETIINGCFEKEVVAGSCSFEDKNIIITVSADYVNITGFNIIDKTGYCSFQSARSCSGIFLYKCNNNNIYGNVLNDLGIGGIIAIQSNNNKLSDNIFHNVFVSGILLDNSKDNVIENNEFLQNNLYSIWLLACENTVIDNNIIKNGNFLGLSLWKSHYNTIFKNSIINNQQIGFALKNSNKNNIYQNNLISNGANYFRNRISTVSLYKSGLNNWEGNYWNQKRISPKPIYGKGEDDNLIRVMDFDKNPAKEPYKIV